MLQTRTMKSVCLSWICSTSLIERIHTFVSDHPQPDINFFLAMSKLTNSTVIATFLVQLIEANFKCIVSRNRIRQRPNLLLWRRRDYKYFVLYPRMLVGADAVITAWRLAADRANLQAPTTCFHDRVRTLGNGRTVENRIDTARNIYFVRLKTQIYNSYLLILFSIYLQIKLYWF